VANPADSVHIDLTWTDNANNENGFKIDRSDDNGATFRPLVTITTANTVAYTDGQAPTNQHLYGLQPGMKYCYRIRAYNDDGDSPNYPAPNQPKVCATTPALPKPVWLNPNPSMQNQIQPYSCEVDGTAAYNSGVRDVQVAVINLTTGITTVLPLTPVSATNQRWYIVAHPIYDPNGGATVYRFDPGRYNLTARAHFHFDGAPGPSDDKDFYSENAPIIGWIVPADSLPC
jgi:hypothetical protein